MPDHNQVCATDGKDEITVRRFTRGLIGPSVEWEGPIKDGGTIEARLAPGCFGPMITPSFRGGHEVTRPIAVEGADVGDAIAITIEELEVTSDATSTGSHVTKNDAFGDDPGIDHVCPECGTEWPETTLRGTGEDAVRCDNCGVNASSYGIDFGYTVVFDDEYNVAMAVDEETASELAADAANAMDLPKNAEQHPILAYESAGMSGTLGRLHPFLGHVGTTPPIDMPDSRNAGDLGQYLIGADHPWGLSDEAELDKRTDAHMDIKEVRAGSILVCPVKIEGGGVYFGDLHANQGDGELAGHTTDVSGTVRATVEVIEGLDIDGPVLLPNEADLPFIARPYTDEERRKGRTLADCHGVELNDDLAPIQVIGSGQTINDATENAVERGAKLLDIDSTELRSRCTFTGGVEIGRLPGTVQLSLLAPLERLETVGLEPFVRDQYNL